MAMGQVDFLDHRDTLIDIGILMTLLCMSEYYGPSQRISYMVQLDGTASYKRHQAK